jgi:hypothetical protein
MSPAAVNLVGGNVDERRYPTGPCDLEHPQYAFEIDGETHRAETDPLVDVRFSGERESSRRGFLHRAVQGPGVHHRHRSAPSDNACWSYAHLPAPPVTRIEREAPLVRSRLAALLDKIAGAQDRIDGVLRGLQAKSKLT